jgi:hypothetical protein
MKVDVHRNVDLGGSWPVVQNNSGGYDLGGDCDTVGVPSVKSARKCERIQRKVLSSLVMAQLYQ